MEIVDGPAQLEDYINTAVQVSGDQPVLVDQYLRDAIEVDVDARRMHLDVSDEEMESRWAAWSGFDSP